MIGATTRSLIGAEVRRREDPTLVSGAGRYVDDLVLPHTAAMAALRSPHAHARLLAIDVTRAAALPGVLAIFTARDLEGRVEPEPAVGIPPTARRPPRPLLARDIVRYVGEPVAAVVAVDRYVAADALDLIAVEYEPLPATVDREAVLAPGAPRVHTDCGIGSWGGWCLSMGDYVTGRPIRRRHPALGSAERPFVLATLRERPFGSYPRPAWSVYRLSRSCCHTASQAACRRTIFPPGYV